jgi:LPS export ABC transporter permease LptF
LGYTLPVACLISVIITFSRLSVDNEIIALRANGVHLGQILVPLLFIGLAMSLCSIVLNERIIPYAHYEQRKMIKTLGVKNPTALLEPGVFIDSFDNQILFVHNIEDNILHNVTIYQPQPDRPTRTIIASKGEFTSVPGKDQIKLKLIDGTSDEPDANNPSKFYKMNFQNYFMTLDMSKDKGKVEKKPKGMTLKELRREIENLQRHLTDASRLKTEYYRKITWSFSAMIFIFLGFPIAVITHRQEKSANIVLAILFAAVYYLMSLGCEALSIKNIVAPIVIMWVPNVVTGAWAFFLNYKCVS